MLSEFKKFIARGNVVDLAVGIIIGAAFTGIVNSLVNDMIMPVVGMLTGGLDFSNFFIALKGGEYTTLKAAKEAGEPVVAYGAFINTLLNFLIVSFAVFVLVKQVNKLRIAQALEPEKPGDAPTPTEKLLAEIRDVLKEKG